VQVYEAGEHDGRPLIGVLRRRQLGSKAGRHSDGVAPGGDAC
jgi:hypothetical protein